MTNLFKKIATSIIGMAMAIGVGIGLSTNSVREAKAASVTMAYSGTTTTNMTGENDAATVGLSATDWSVVGAKGSANNFPGLNKAGQIRLYYNASGSNTITVTSLNGWTINSITLSLGEDNNNIVVKVGSSTITGTDNVYPINATSFVLGNGYSSNKQVYILSCVINYTSSGPTLNKVSYNANIEGYDGATPDDQTQATEGASITLASALSFSGYTWVGWNTSSSGGQATRHAAGSSYTPTTDITMYGEWIRTLDAITAIGGTVVGSVTNSGTKSWDFSGVTVTGTISGLAGQNVKDFVDLSSTTNIPDTTGSCTVSVTATKKNDVSGSATSFTNASVSGTVEAAKLTYSVTLSYDQLWLKADKDAGRVDVISYANENSHEKTSAATCENHDDYDVTWITNQVMNENGTSTVMMFQKTNGYLYNSSELPGTITDVTLNGVSSGSFTVYYGNSAHPTSGTTVGGKFFTVQTGTSVAGKLASVTVTFEVSDKNRVTLSATNMSLDVSDGAALPTITDGTSPISGYTLISEDEHIASITNDGKVQPVGYGKTKIDVTKAEDSSNIYAATSFVVTVSDQSKNVSTMDFSEKAEGSATANDGVEWTIEADQNENEFSEVYGINFGSNNNKVSSLTLTAPADSQRIIKNVVVEAMSSNTGSTISVSVNSTDFVCSKSTSLTGSVATYNFSGNVSGEIVITLSGTASPKYGVKSIAVLYVGDEAESFASTFLGAIACNSQGTSKPTFAIKTGETHWTWALLKAEFDALSPTDQAKFAKGISGDENGTNIQRAIARYDYIVGKYYVTGLDTTLISSDFMSRDPAAIGGANVTIVSLASNSNNTVIIVVVISMLSITALGGFFFLRKRKEEK